MKKTASSGIDSCFLEISDEKLMAKFKRGNVKAMDELVRRYEKPLYSFLWRMTGNAADTQDVFQEVWLRVISKARYFKEDRFKGWVFTIAHNLAIDACLKKNKLVSLDVSLPEQDKEGISGLNMLATPHAGPAEQAQTNDTISAIDRALARLPDEQRSVFLLRMESELTFREIAACQGIALNTCLGRMQYAVSKLRLLLKKHGPEGGR